MELLGASCTPTAPPSHPPCPPGATRAVGGRPKLLFLNVQRFFWRMGVLLGLARTDHDRRALLRQHEDRDTPLWLLSPTHTTNGTSQPKKQLRPESERPQQPPPCACGRRAVRAAVCGVGWSCAHTNTQLAPPRWLCSQCRPSARRWVWTPVDVAACDCAAARRHGADDTRSCDRKAGSAEPNDKKQ